MPRILITEPIHEAGRALLEAAPGFEILSGAVEEALPQAEAILVRTHELDAATLARAPGLRIISKHGVGCDNIALDHCAAAGVTVAVTADANSNAVMEHTFAFLLHAALRLGDQDAATRSGDWAARQQVPAVELHGKTLLVIGLGRIGGRVARLARAFDMRVIGVDPAVNLPEAEMTTDLAAAVAEADFITVHTPLTARTRHMFDAALLAHAQGAVLVNCARGGIVDEAAVAEALDAGRLSFYAADVFETEPAPAGHPLLSRNDTVLTPHSGAMTDNARRNMSTRSAQNIIDYFAGRFDEAFRFAPDA